MAAGLCDKQALEAYKAEKACLPLWLDLQRAYCRVFFTMIIALMAASVGGGWPVATYILGDSPNSSLWLLPVAVGPCLAAVLCWVGSKESDRNFRIYVESVSLVVKLEYVVGLAALRAPDPDRPFPQDDYFIPQRWRWDRNHDTAEEFVQSRMRLGMNSVVHSAYLVLGCFNALCAVGVVLVAVLYSKSSGLV